jgi:hypothetical protein
MTLLRTLVTLRNNVLVLSALGQLACFGTSTQEGSNRWPGKCVCVCRELGWVGKAVDALA